MSNGPKDAAAAHHGVAVKWFAEEPAGDSMILLKRVEASDGQSLAYVDLSLLFDHAYNSSPTVDGT